MRIRVFTRFPRLKELAGALLLLGALAFLVSLATYSPGDASWNTATWRTPPHNRIGVIGSHISDLTFQAFGLAAWPVPLLLALLGWRWFRGRAVSSPVVRIFGYALMLGAVAGGFSLLLPFNPYEGAFPVGGVVGHVISTTLMGSLNDLGSAIFLLAILVISIYLVSTFSISSAGDAAGAWLSTRFGRFRRRKAIRPEAEELSSDSSEPGIIESAAAERRARRRAAAAASSGAIAVSPSGLAADLAEIPLPFMEEIGALETAVNARARSNGPPNGHSHAGSGHSSAAVAELPPWEEDIPIRPLAADPEPKIKPREPESKSTPRRGEAPRAAYRLPSTRLLNPPPEREGYDSAELKEIAARIKSKLEEFNVLGNVVQINPGPVVTTFEFKPDAGVKIARITTLSEDLCLGLQAESILIERIPGKPTVGIEVPNNRRETISLRQILEADEFHGSASRLTIPMGKDITGRIRISELEKMPHLLIAGSTGSGKSVMLNALIMSVLFKSTPDEVRMILVDPKRVELGVYDGIPHLLTPVITEPKKAVNALRNAVLEMERRLKLLASFGVRNIDQFNRKIRQGMEKPLSLFPEDNEPEEQERPLPYILIVIDELADLMMLERAGVEESVIRLAQMSRAVGIHLVLATQRPSVDVITGLIKANFPARISFRVATRVDSRTVLDVMGAEHLLGKGDMLFLPPGTGRLLRVHGPFTTESEITEVVDFWRQQADPDYDQTFLLAPPSEEDEFGEDDEMDGEEDPLYRDAVRVVCEMGKASTSILQRRLRLGYGRAARILDRMQKEGIIGPPDGSRPRDVYRRPDWLDAPRDNDDDGAPLSLR